MLRLLLPRPAAGLRVLCLGAHSDDIELGCGGTVLQLLAEYPHTDFRWVVFSADQQRSEEAKASAAAFLAEAQSKQVCVLGYQDGFFPYVGGQIKSYFEGLKEFAPDLVLTHYRGDLHQDHRLICELTWNTFRDHLILEYEIPKYDGDLGAPNLFVELQEEICRRKARYMLDAFESQVNKHWFSEETFRALLRIRGIESRANSGYAEAFYCRKVVLGKNSVTHPE
ncbi:MAG TPA: PIG-L deacetylase family protein [Terriglobales bacterium]|nr:PIG-L deacetylase family protein [Terriglobales bacterium]